MSDTAGAAAHERQVRRAVVASAVGTAIEWYDFFLYGLAAALVFPTTFFPRSDPFVGTLLSFTTYFVGFLARPLGAAVFGHFGDRLGRKASLVATLLLMGGATVAIGLVPGYDRIGIYGAVLLTLCRALQGVGVGGEWGGSVLLAAEWSDARRRGFAASWPQFGAPAGLLLANGVLAVMNRASPAAFLAWSWRVPFLLSAVLVVVGLLIRLGVEETPAFAKIRASRAVERAPVAAVLRGHWREVLLTALLRSSEQTPFYLFSTFVLTYGTTVLHLDRAMLLRDVLVGAALTMAAIPLWGHLADRVGRRRFYAFGIAAMAVWVFAYFRLLDTRDPRWVFLAIACAQSIHGLQYAPQAALIAETFPSHLRYSGASLGYQLASITAGGPAPLVALYLLKTWSSSTAIAAYVALSAAVSMTALRLLPDHSRRDLSAS